MQTEASLRVQIVQRHCEVPEVVQTRTREKIERLSRYDPRLSSAEIIFDAEKHTKRTEGILSLDGDDPVVAKGEGGEFHESLDQLVDRLSKILRRRRAQLKNHQGPPLSEVVVPQAAAPEE